MLLSSRFEGFLNRKNVHLVPEPEIDPQQLREGKVERDELHRCAQDVAFHVTLPHEFPRCADPLASLEDVREKYARRADRLFEVLESDKQVLLVRSGITRDQAVQLRGLIDKQFPRLKYSILAIGDTDDMKRPWGIDRVANFYHPTKAPGDWEGDSEVYHAVLSAFDITKTADDRTQNPSLYQAGVICNDLPATLTTGAKYKVPLTLANQSPLTWYGPFGGTPYVNFSYHWMKASDRSVYKWDNERSVLLQPLPGGKSVSLQADISAPAEPGNYILQWDLVIEQIAWFSGRGWQPPEHAAWVI